MSDNVEWSTDRDRKSLQYLTKHFVDIIKAAGDGCLNLRDAAQVMDVKQIRRIYDITNVLEGIGLIVKKSKNTVQWRGFQGGVSREQNSLTEELQALEEKERYVDKLLGWAKQNTRYTLQDSRPLVYVTRDDLLQSFFKHSVLTVKGHTQVQRLPVMVDNTIMTGRGLRIASTRQPIEVLMATTEGKALIETSANDDWKGDLLGGGGGASGNGGGGGAAGGKRKSKLIPTLPIAVNPNAVPDHFEADRPVEDKKGIQLRFQEYKKTANLLLNLRTRNPVQERRLRLRNYYQAKAPFVKLSDNMSTDYPFSLYEDEGISDLFDIALPPPSAQLVAGDNEELFEDEDETDNLLDRLDDRLDISE